MGYYSNVRVSTTKKGYEDFLSYVPDEFKDPKKWCLFDQDAKPYIIDEAGDSVIFGWDSVKWYENWGLTTSGENPFADVDAVMKAIRRVIDEGMEPLYYIRVGEEYIDVDEFGNECADNGDLPRCIGVENKIYIY